MQKTNAAGRKNTSARAVLGKKEKKRLIQLVFCLCLFFVVFIGKGHTSGELSQTGANILRLIQSDTDFQQLFHGLGEILTGDRDALNILNPFVSGIFDGQREEALTIQQKGPAVQMVQLTLRQKPTGESLLTAIGQTPDHKSTSVPEANQTETVPPSEATPAPEITPEPVVTQEPIPSTQISPDLTEYTGPALPAGASMNYYDLGLGETVTPVFGILTSPYGYRDHPISGEYIFHAGVDISANVGTPIRAFSGGTVDFVGQSDSYGLYIQIDHGNGITTFYCHCSELCVPKGESVAVGQIIAKTGDTGNTTGPHLHMEMKKDGVLINPEYYIEIKQT